MQSSLLRLDMALHASLRAAGVTPPASSHYLIGDVRDALASVPSGSVRCAVTSPPYYRLRDYGEAAQIGQETSPEQYVSALVLVFREVRRILTDDGTFWLNIGDCYSKDKNRMLMPARVALALQGDGWFLRDEIVWHKPRTTPAPMTDRTVAAHEMLYTLTKNGRYFYNYESLMEPAAYPGLVRNVRSAFRLQSNPTTEAGKYGGRTQVVVGDKRRSRSVWSISPSPYKEAHFATMPSALAEKCILAGSEPGDWVLDPFGGAGTTAGMAVKNGRSAVSCEINAGYVGIARKRFPA